MAKKTTAEQDEKTAKEEKEVYDTSEEFVEDVVDKLKEVGLEKAVVDLDEEPIKNTDITTYAHHGAMVQVKRDLKGKHRKYSLCYQCEFFKPETLNNCHIAQAVFDNCVKFHVTTPVWECPEFKIAKS